MVFLSRKKSISRKKSEIQRLILSVPLFLPSSLFVSRDAQTVRVRYMNEVGVIPPASSFYANATSTYSALDEGSGTGNPSSRIASI